MLNWNTLHFTLHCYGEETTGYIGVSILLEESIFKVGKFLKAGVLPFSVVPAFFPDVDQTEKLYLEQDFIEFFPCCLCLPFHCCRWCWERRTCQENNQGWEAAIINGWSHLHTIYLSLSDKSESDGGACQLGFHVRLSCILREITYVKKTLLRKSTSPLYVIIVIIYAED